MLAARHVELAEASELYPAEQPDDAPRSRRRPARNPFSRVVLTAVTVALLCSGFVGQRIALMHLTYQLDAEMQRLRQVAQENEHLRLQVERARSLDRIEAIARGRLGMQPPGQREVVVIPGRLAPSVGEPAVQPVHPSDDRLNPSWLAALIDWANERWPMRTAEAGRWEGR